MGILTNSALRADLGNQLRGLHESLTRLAEHVQRQARDAWVWRRPHEGTRAVSGPPAEFSPERTREEVAEAITAIKYVDGQGVYESRIAPGVVVVSEEGIVLVEQANACKLALAAALAAMKGRTEVGVIDPRTGERGVRPLREVALEAFYFGRLHHWQATRELVVLRESDEWIGTPEYISFMWANVKDVRQTSREEAMERIKRAQSATDNPIPNDRDFQALQQLPPGEPLAIVKRGRVIPKANIRWPTRSSGCPKPRVHSAVLPLFMLGHQVPARFRRLPAAPTPKEFRLTRSDTEIESVSLLDTMPVHQYRAEFRDEKRAELSRNSGTLNGRTA
ncbi:MAG: hypothetical protein JWL65_141 [Gammaproteobacteria bacterium]|nr:hypothetical protein [Gammaproteobacteria bacterium]